MPQSKKTARFGSRQKGKIIREGRGVKLVIEVEAIIYAQNIEGRNYALTRTFTGCPGLTFLQAGEFERLESEGVKRVSLKNALRVEKEFLLKSEKIRKSQRRSVLKERASVSTSKGRR